MSLKQRIVIFPLQCNTKEIVLNNENNKLTLKEEG